MTTKNQNGQPPLDQRTLYLINRSVDGEITASEQEELDRLLSTSPEVHDLHDSLGKVANLLDKAPEIEPPEYLKGAIERQVRLPVQEYKKTANRGLWGIEWFNMSWLGTGLALAAGVVLTVGVYQMDSEPVSDRDSASMVGTIAKRGPHGQAGALLDSVQLDTSRLNGLVELRNKDDLFTLSLKLNTGEPTDVVIDFAGRGLEFGDVTGAQADDYRVAIEDGSIHLAGTGEQQYTVILKRTSGVKNAAPLDVNFLAGNELILQAKLIISED